MRQILNVTKAIQHTHNTLYFRLMSRLMMCVTCVQEQASDRDQAVVMWPSSRAWGSNCSPLRCPAKCPVRRGDPVVGRLAMPPVSSPSVFAKSSGWRAGHPDQTGHDAASRGFESPQSVFWAWVWAWRAHWRRRCHGLGCKNAQTSVTVSGEKETRQTVGRTPSRLPASRSFQ